MNKYKILSAIELILIVLLVGLNYGWPNVFSNQTTPPPPSEPVLPDFALMAWTESIQKMDYTADAGFIGDSLTQQSDFQKYFPTKRIVNLGIGGDTIQMVADRTNMLSAFSPAQIYVLVGINQSKAMNTDNFRLFYEELCENLSKERGSAKVYIQSVLPVSKEKEETYGPNTRIDAYNIILQELSKTYGFTYIDLNQAFKEDGYMNADLTTDGVHLTEAGYDIWAGILEDYLFDNA